MKAIWDKRYKKDRRKMGSEGEKRIRVGMMRVMCDKKRETKKGRAV